MKPLVLLIGKTSGWREALARRDAEMAEIKLMDELGDLSLPRPPAGAFVELGKDPDAGLRAIARLRAVAPEAPIVAVAGEKDPDLILRAMRAGTSEFVLFAEDGAQHEALQEIIGRGRRGGLARVVAVMPACGGAGATTIAVNLGRALAQGGARVALVDLDFHMGDVLLFLDLDPGLPIADLLDNEERMDAELLLSSLPRHGERLWVASQSGPVEQRDQVAPADIPRLLGLLRPHFDFLVLDGLHGLGEHTRRALTMTDQLLLVVTPEVPAVKHAQHCLAYLPLLGFDPAHVHVIANRVNRRGSVVEVDQMEEFLARPIAGRLSDDYPTVSRAIRDGRPLHDEAPRAAVTRELGSLAAIVSGHHEAKRGGLLSLLFGRHRAAERPASHEENAHGSAA